MKKYINITASLSFWDSYSINSESKNYKKIRLCNQTDFEKINYPFGF